MRIITATHATTTIAIFAATSSFLAAFCMASSIQMRAFPSLWMQSGEQGFENHYKQNVSRNSMEFLQPHFPMWNGESGNLALQALAAAGNRARLPAVPSSRRKRRPLGPAGTLVPRFPGD